MADETEVQPGAEGETPEGGAPAGGKKKKMLMIISAAVAVLGVAIGGGVFFMLQGGHKEEQHAPVPVFYDMPQMAVNLLSEGEEQHFLKVKMAFELGKAEDATALAALLPVVQDDFQAFLRQMRVDDMRGSAALARLKDALLLRVNQIVAQQKIVVKDVLFREVLVQ